MLLFFSFFVLLFWLNSKALEALKGNKHLFANVCGTHERSYKTLRQSESRLHLPLRKLKYVWNNLNERFHDIHVYLQPCELEKVTDGSVTITFTNNNGNETDGEYQLQRILSPIALLDDNTWWCEVGFLFVKSLWLISVENHANYRLLKQIVLEWKIHF